MIFDRVDNLRRYCGGSKRLEQVARFLETTKLAQLPIGQTVIDGNSIFLNHMIYTTSLKTEDSLFESHQKYLDLHVILRGQEIMAVTPVRQLQELERREAEDSIMYCGDISYSLPLKEGDFLLVYPGEGHLPRLIYEVSCQVEKVVVKIAL